MRVIIYGAGAIGGSIGARLARAGHDVVLICRGAHLEAIRANGLLMQTPDEEFRQPMTAVGHPSEIDFRPGDVVLLTMKAQHTAGALFDLEVAAGTGVPVVCAQNGVENERMASRRFENVYSMLVHLPGTHIVPGEVMDSGSPLSGVLHAGGYPGGTDATIEELCAKLETANFRADPDPKVLRLKYAKLLTNLWNGIDIILAKDRRGPEGAVPALLEKARAEARACLAAAGIDYADEAEFAERVTGLYDIVPIAGKERVGGSTFQSILRGHRETEVDYLNGEIVLLGRLYGIPTPYNAALRREAVRIAALGLPPGQLSLEEFEAGV